MRILASAFLPLAFVSFAYAQDLPDGPGKDVTVRVCGACHDAGVVAQYHNSKDDWQPIVDDMRGRGADGSDADFKLIVDYLGHYFGPTVFINKAPESEIETLGLTSAEAAAIVKYRQANGDFKDMDSLRKVPGLDMKKLEPIQSRILFQ
ncbi:MAG TPA: helix-hairpin-helix domain-containing protein [Bryobacteraceae bacterium]|nr:helix-hairpin-helix domain-containing protein [Bryobacteraceae bacterium]